MLSLILMLAAAPCVTAAAAAYSDAPSVSLKAGKGNLEVKWKKVKGAKSYQLQYSKNKKFKKAKSVTVKGKKYKIKNLPYLKRYYVRVRARLKENGKYRYGKWSSVRFKTVKAEKSSFNPLIDMLPQIVENPDSEKINDFNFRTEIELPEELRYETPFVPEGAQVTYYDSLYSASQAQPCEEANAVCLMYSENGTDYIEMFDNSEESESVAFGSNVSINLRKHAVTFADGKYITANADFTLSNGTVNTLNGAYSVYSPAANSDGTLKISGVTFNSDINYARSTTNVIFSSAINTELKKLVINLSGVGSNSLEYLGVTLNGTSKQNSSDIENVRVNISLEKASAIYGIKDSTLTQNNKNCKVNINCDNTFKGSANGIKTVNVSGEQNVNIENPEVTVITNNTSTQYGINDSRVNKDGEFNLTDAKVRVINASGPARGVSIYGKCACITGGEIFAEQTNNATDGVGIFLNGYDGSNRYAQNITVTGNEEHPLISYGKLSGILVRKGTYNLNGGTYTSVAHSGYLAGNTTVRGATFKIANRELYTKAQLTDTGNASDSADAWGLYFGCQYSSENTDVINMYNCIIGNEPSCGYEMLDNMSRSSLSAKCGYVQPKEVNLYDCDIYCGSRFVFRYVDAYKATRYNMTTKFNLYGSTRIFNRFGGEYTKQEIRTSAMNWRTSYITASKSVKESNEADNKYYVHNGGTSTKLIGYSYYCPSEDSDMNDQIRDSYGTLSGDDKEQYLNADAVNVHDYRD